MTDHHLGRLLELEPAPRRKGFRIAPPGWPGPADAIGPVFAIAADVLWRAWIAYAASRPRTVLRAQDEHTWRSLHIQRSPMFRFPDLVRAEIVALGPERSSLVLDSRARFGCWDLGVNRRRVACWIDALQKATAHDSLG